MLQDSVRHPNDTVTRGGGGGGLLGCGRRRPPQLTVGQRPPWGGGGWEGGFWEGRWGVGPSPQPFRGMEGKGLRPGLAPWNIF